MKALFCSIATTGLALLGCGVGEPPTQPSWQTDVMPILAANCVRCHGYPTNGFAAVGFRLDSFDKIDVAGLDAPIDGAAHTATLLAQRTQYSRFRPDDVLMPPGRELESYELDVLRNWAGLVDFAMKAPRGEGRANNAAPELTLTEVGRSGTQVTFAYELTDGDGDLVVGNVRGPTRRAVQVVDGVIGDLISGRDTFVVDLSGIPAGTYPLTARLDDGADIDGPDADQDFIELPIGMLEITP